MELDYSHGLGAIRGLLCILSAGSFLCVCLSFIIFSGGSLSSAGVWVVCVCVCVVVAGRYSTCVCVCVTFYQVVLLIYMVFMKTYLINTNKY